jgi:hypothetical protein
VPLRPLALGELLDGSIKVIRRYPRPTLGLSAAIAVAVTVLNVIAVLLFDPGFEVSAEDELDGSQLAGAAATAIPAQLIAFIGGLVLTGALITVVGKAVQGKEAPFDQVWATVRPRIWSLLGLALLTGLIVVGPFVLGILLAVVLGIAIGDAGIAIGALVAVAGFVLLVYLYVRLSLAPASLVLERAGVRESLRRSGVLVEGSWWRLFGIMILTWLITAVLSGIVGAVLAIPVLIAVGSEGTGFLIAQQVAAGLASVVLSPFASGVRALLYVDRRMRAEGLDLALQAAVADG